MIRLTDSLSGKKETFTPGGDTVKMYVCGVTPYDESHIGHAMSYIIFDVIRRYLRYRGYRVKYVQNVTDIDDKLIDRAARLGTTTTALAEKFTKSYQDDMAALNIEPPDENPRATGEITKIIEVIAGLVAKGYAYPAAGSVYFRVRNVPDYGKLSHRTLDSMMAGARIEPGEEKEHPMDFVLWKAAKPGEPFWESLWGKGRPGWHIECSAMALKYLGESIDIHGGGQDLIFPHHENEIAQSESFTGVKPFARYWLHNGLLQVGDAKMSKSTGNLISIKEILTRHRADTLRLFVLSSTYRSPLTFSEEGLEAAGRGAERLVQTAGRSSGKGQKLDVSAYQKQFLEAMDDDFNSARALSSLFDMARAINQAADSGQNVDDALKTLKELSQNVLGLTLKAPERHFTNLGGNKKIIGRAPTIIKNANEFISLGKSLAPEIRKTLPELADKLESNYTKGNDAAEYIDWLVIAREKLRAAKQFGLADNIRKDLLELGVSLEDTPQGTVWKYRK